MNAKAQLRKKLQSEAVPEFVQQLFLKQVAQLEAGVQSTIATSDIAPVPDLPKLQDLQGARERGVSLLSKLVVLKLNGGLGTGMGLKGAKSLLPVRDGLTFLDVIAQQVLSQREQLGIELPLVFMNSFRTESDTEVALSRYPALSGGNGGLPLGVCQHQVPRLLEENFEPLDWPEDRSLEWCPPGHGDLYSVLVTRGLLAAAIKRGFRYLFVSNSDNLGAVVEPALLGYLAEQDSPFLMEVALREEADKKGGHLAIGQDGHLILRERAQCASADELDFQDIARHRYFNTNSLWIDLEKIQKALDEDEFNLPIIANRKTADPRDDASPKVVQIETAMGSALSILPGAIAVEIPRTRFVPVKTTEDLLVLRSDRYSITDDARLVSNSSSPVVVSLDQNYYRTIPQFEARFPEGSPSLLKCTRFTIQGDVLVKGGVNCEGEVALRNKGSQQAVLDESRTLSGIVELFEEENA